MKYKCNDEGVAALRTMARKLDEAVETIASLCSQAASAAEENRDSLGPHVSELNDAIESIQSAVNSSSSAATDVSEKLNSVASKYEAIIAKNPFRKAGN